MLKKGYQGDPLVHGLSARGIPSQKSFAIKPPLAAPNIVAPPSVGHFTMSQEPNSFFIPQEKSEHRDNMVRDYLKTIGSKLDPYWDADFSEDVETYRQDGRDYYSTNVSLLYAKNGFVDMDEVEKVIKSLNVPDDIKEELEDEFDSSYVEGTYYDWIEREQDDIRDLFQSGGKNHFTERKWWMENVMAKIEAGEKTSYPAINELPTKEEKKKLLEEWMAEAELYLDAFEIVEADSVGFYGRGGKHFGFKADTSELQYKAEEIQEMIDNLVYYNLEGAETKDVVRQIRQIEVEQRELEKMADKFVDKINLLLNYVKNMSKGLDFNAEMKYIIEMKADEIVDDRAQEEIRRKRSENMTLDAFASKQKHKGEEPELIDLLLSDLSGGDSLEHPDDYGFYSVPKQPTIVKVEPVDPQLKNVEKVVTIQRGKRRWQISAIRRVDGKGLFYLVKTNSTRKQFGKVIGTKSDLLEQYPSIKGEIQENVPGRRS